MKFLYLFPLQSVSDFSISDQSMSVKDFLVFFGVAAVVITVIVILNNMKKTPGKKSGSGGGLFPGFALLKISRNLGLNHEQRKMLDFVFKSDAVTDPEKSIITPSLLDRHFRRGYRIIEQSKTGDAEIQRKHAILFSTRNVLENSSFGGLTNTRQVKDDTSIVINTGKEKINTIVITSKSENIVAETPKTVLGSQIKIPKGTKINVLLFTKNNKSFTFESKVTGYSSMHGHPTMLLAHSNQIKFLAQRRFRRKHAVIACSLNLVYVEGSGKKQRLIVDKRKLSGNIVDISVGGCSIKTTAPVQVGARFKVEFTQGDNTLAALGQVLRTNKVSGVTVIHMKFLRVTQKTMNQINAFVYEYIND